MHQLRFHLEWLRCDIIEEMILEGDDASEQEAVDRCLEQGVADDESEV